MLQEHCRQYVETHPVLLCLYADDHILDAVGRWTVENHSTVPYVAFFDDDFNDSPLEFHAFFKNDDDAVEWRMRCPYSVEVSTRYAQHDYHTAEQHAHQIERETRHSTVYGPHLDGIRTEAGQGRKDFFKLMRLKYGHKPLRP